MLRLLIKKSRSARLAPLLIAAASGVAACSDYKPETDTLSSVGADWSCLRPLPPEDVTNRPDAPGDPVFYSLRLVDLATQSPMVGVNVRACGLFDITCRQPVGAPLQTDSEGFVRVPLTENFVGYLEIITEGAVPYIFHLPNTKLRSMTDFPLAMIALAGFGDLLKAFNLADNQTLGSIGFRVFDCRGLPAAGVRLESDAEGQSWYFEDDLPTVLRKTTDLDGLGGFIGSEEGVSNLTAVLPDGRAVSKRQIIVRPLWMSAGYLKANPNLP